MKPRDVLFAFLVVALLAPQAMAHAANLSPTQVSLDPASVTPTLDTVAKTWGEVASKVLPRAHQLGPVTASDYTVEFRCPEDPTGLLGGACPYRVVDEDDILGNPGLAVDPVVPGRIAFTSLHGGAAGGPRPLTRDGQTHTTFTTSVFGLQWTDQPYSPPSRLGGGNRDIRGEDTHGLIDSSRVLHVASLYSHRGADGGGWGSSIVLWKFDQEARDLDYNLVLDVFENLGNGSRIETMWLVEVPEAQRVVLVWHETTPAEAPVEFEGRNVTSWLNFAVTRPDTFTEWERIGKGPVIGNCDVPTTPGVFETRIYIGCQSRDGTAEVPAGGVALWALDVATREPIALGNTPIVGGKPALAVDTSGRIALVSMQAVEDLREVKERVRAEDANATANDTNNTNNTSNNSATNVTNTTPPNATKPRIVNGATWAQIATTKVSDDGISDWTRTYDFGDDLHNMSLGVKTARVNAILYREMTNTIHMVVLEEADKNDTDDGHPRWRKSFVVIDPLGTVLLNLDLRTSDKGEVFRGSGGGGRQDVYGDTRDSLLEVSGEEYIAFADYGVIVFAGIVEFDDRIETIVLQQSPPIPEPVPVVQASVLTTTNVAIVGSVATVAAARLAIVRFARATGQGRDKK